jgi:hypothetical protein
MGLVDWGRRLQGSAAHRALLLVAGLLALVAVAFPLSHATRADGASVGVACSWFGESDQRDVNIGAPDLNAQYLYAPLDGLGGSQIEITGSYPSARYFSFTLYGNSENAETSIYDQTIRPDPGSYNPFLRSGKRGQARNYLVHVLFANPPKHPAANTLYAGAAKPPGTLGFLVLRIYIPVGSRSGGVPWPQVHVLSSSGASELSEGACAAIPPSFGSWYWKLEAGESAPANQKTPADGTDATPLWTRSFSNGFGNQQNSYLQVLISHHWGQLVVAHFKAPTFPNTSAGVPVFGRHDLRYWSICTYDSSGTAVYGCVPDYLVPEHNGWVTYVVSDVAHRPANATSADGVAWLPWGPSNEMQIMERNMLPEASFSGASQRIAVPADNPRAAKIMGNYYPTSAYCSERTFARGGWQACLPALARRLAKRR